MTKQNKSGYIYIIQAIGTTHYKIGQTRKEPSRRLADLQTGNPYRLRLLHYVRTEDMDALEKEMHECYKAERLDGEWFNFFDVQPVIQALDEKSGEQPALRSDTYSDIDRLGDKLAGALYDIATMLDARLAAIESRLGDLETELRLARNTKDAPVLYSPAGEPLSEFQLMMYVADLSDDTFEQWD